MSIINNGLLLASGADAATTYQISRSIRLNSADSAYFSRTPGSAGNRRTWTFSCWVKRCEFGVRHSLFTAGSDGTEVVFDTDNTLLVYYYSGGAYRGRTRTNGAFRDPSAWYHVVVSINTTQTGNDNIAKIYVNGTQQSVTHNNNWNTNDDTDVNNTVAHNIGKYSAGSNYYFNGYLADIYLLDGTATTPSTFAETDAITGQWVPKTPTGISYGTNGFRLTFSDNSGTTSTTLGKDAAGSNNWSPNNFSVASGSGNDSLVDSPTSYGTDLGVGGEVRGNYCTLNPLWKESSVTLTNGNLDMSTGGSDTFVGASIGMSSGKWYAEFTVGSLGKAMLGLAQNPVSLSNYLGSDAYGWSYYSVDGGKRNNGTYTAGYGSTFGAGDVIGIAFDADNGKLYFSKNGTWQSSGNPASGTNAAFTGLTSGSYFFAHSISNANGSWNFGQRAFAYTAPSGFKALCDTNLTAPTIAKPNTVFDAVPYTGSSGSQSITTNFSPDLVWVKTRNAATDHEIYDIVRGAGVRLSSNNTSADNSLGANGLSSFNSNGFTVPSTANYGINGSGYTYVAWAWDAGTSTVTNTQGSITSSVRANASAGFSIVTYTGVSGTQTVGHGLGAEPSLIIVKRRSNADDWQTYVKTLGNAKRLLLNSTSAEISDATIWASTSPTSTVFTIGGSNPANQAGSTYVAYCFAPVAGYSSFGSYTGNGSTDGPFVFCGFRPRWILTKRYDGGANGWGMFDALRPGYNLTDSFLQAQSSGSESTGASAYSIDILSNGFKVRGTDAFVNQSGGSYIYCAFAESPLQYARAR